MTIDERINEVCLIAMKELNYLKSYSIKRVSCNSIRVKFTLCINKKHYKRMFYIDSDVLEDYWTFTDLAIEIFWFINKCLIKILCEKDG